MPTFKNKREREAWLRSLPFDPRKVCDPNLTLPDLSEAPTGWRVWGCPQTLPLHGLSPKLYSTTESGYYWTPGRAATAECRHFDGATSMFCDPVTGHEVLHGPVPNEYCTCGFYSAKNLRHLLHIGYPIRDARGDGRVPVIGKVACWGRVIEGTQGWRSGKAYPVQLYVLPEHSHLAKPLAKGYDCKVAIFNFLDPNLRSM